MEQQAGRTFKLLSLGDSYTIGEQVPEEENFPHQLVRRLKPLGLPFESPRIIAKTGWTTDELQQAIDSARPGNDFDFVTLLIGVNNQYRGRKVEDYVPDFESLLHQAIQFAGSKADRVAVLSIPDWSVTPFAGQPKDDGSMHDRNAVAAAIDRYNEANEAISKRMGVHYVGITGGTREAKENPSLLAADGLHPSGIEYNRWAEKLASIVFKALLNRKQLNT